MEEGPQVPHHRDRENCSSLITNSLADIESSLQRDAEAAYTHPEVSPPQRVARLKVAAAAQIRPGGLFWMWPLAWGYFLLGLADPVFVPLAPACFSRHSPAAAGM